MTKQAIRLDCPDVTWPRCTFTIDASFANGGAEAVPAFAVAPPGWAFEIDGRAIAPSELAVPARGRLDVVARGALELEAEPEPRGDRGYCGDEVPDPIYMRHLALAEPRYTMRAHVPRFADAPTATIVASADREITFDAERSTFRTRRFGSPLRIGGPFVALGGRFRDSREGDVTARVGYEIGQRKWLVESLAVESDFTKSVVVAAAIEAAQTLYPGFGWAAGIGVPLRVARETAVGVRGQLTLQMLSVALLIAGDYYPSLPGELATTSSVFGQVSF